MTLLVLIGTAIFFFGMGVFALAAPAALIAPFAITPDEPVSRAEIRAVYGGFGVALGVLLTIAAINPGFHRTGIMITAGTALAGMAFGRLVHAVIDKPTAFYPNWFYFIAEALTAATLFVTAW